MSEFFNQLEKFSKRVFQKMKIHEEISPWSYGLFKNGFPTGAILHYTTGSKIKRTIRWFMRTKYAAKASAHVIVDDCWPDEFRELSEDFPLVHRLPTMVVQCMLPHRTAWHATWTNSFCYGIEMVNCGVVKHVGGVWQSETDQPMKEDKAPVFMYGKHWDPYPVQQVLSVIEILRELRKKFGAASLPRWMILGHEQVQDNKEDPGPLFPLNGVRLATYEDLHPSAYHWFNAMAQNPQSGEDWRSKLAMNFLEDSDPKRAWETFYSVLCDDFLDGEEFGGLGKIVMRILGYFMSHNPTLTKEDRESIGVFQRMSGLKVDGIPGPITRTAIMDRYEQRGFMP